jgi:TPR repeat protein
VRNPAALTRLSVPSKIGRAVFSFAFLGGLGLSPARAESGQPVNLAQMQERAERSDPDAQNSLGNAYSSGMGVKQDYATALIWYRRAAVQGYSPAEFNLGLAYELGRGVPVDERQAFKYYLMAAEQGFGSAQFNIGNMYSAGRGVGQDLFEATLWYKQAAEKGIT